MVVGKAYLRLERQSRNNASIKGKCFFVIQNPTEKCGQGRGRFRDPQGRGVRGIGSL
jgi:hypothetical protein